jgi:phenylacetate-CoA ligase
VKIILKTRELFAFTWNVILKRKQFFVYRELLKQQYDPLETVKEREFDLLKETLNFAFLNIPYYRKVLSDCGLVDNGRLSFNSTSDLHKIPTLDKAIIKEQDENLYFAKHKKRKSCFNTSGGSTGAPIIVLQDKHFFTRSQAHFWLIMKWRKVNLQCRTFYLWGAVRDNKGGLKKAISRYASNMTFVNSSKLSNDDKNEIIDGLNKNNPALIIAYAQSIYELACFASKNKINVVPQNAIHTGAGTLYDYMREKIEIVFGCKVYNHYGGREVGPIASECSHHDGLHILSENIYVEILDEFGNPCKDGVVGEVVLTSLTNFSMPLIRYRVGDLAVKMPPHKCSCGVNYPKLSRIVGRTSDNLRTINDEMVSGEFLTLTYNYVKGVESFRIIQLELELIHIKLVVNSEYQRADSESSISSKMQDLFGSNLQLEFIYVDAIEKTSTGKHLFTINNIK